MVYIKWIGKTITYDQCFRFSATSSLYQYELETVNTNLFENWTRIHEIVDLCRFFHLEMGLVRSCFSIAKSPEKRIFDVRASAPGDRKFGIIIAPPLPLNHGVRGREGQRHQQYQQQQLLQAAAS